jgi:hypothetical protein
LVDRLERYAGLLAHACDHAHTSQLVTGSLIAEQAAHWPSERGVGGS